MEFLSPVYQGGLADEIDRICGTTATIYSNKAKVVRINEAIDKYFALGNYQFEDSNQSSVPIETIDLVDGTGRYALGDLTSELLNFLRVEVTDSSGNDYLIFSNKLSNINGAYDEYYKDEGVPSEYIKIGKYIDLRPIPSYNATSGLKIYFDRPASKYEFVSITANTDDTLTTTAVHGLSALDAVIFETDGTIITPITADTVVYYVITDGLTTTKFKVSTAYSATGTAVNISDAQAGSNHKFLKVSRTPGIPSIHHTFLARHASLPFLAEKKLPQLNSIAQLLAKDEKEIKEYFNQRNKDERNIMSMAGISFR